MRAGAWQGRRPLRIRSCGTPWEAPGGARWGLLPGHGDAETFFGVDEVVVVVGAEIDLDPVDLAGEPAAVSGVVGRDGGAGFVADVGGLVGGEDHRLGSADTARADR